MNFSKALDQVGEIYVPGAVAYFAKMVPDPWQEMHDDFEKVMLLGDRSLEDLACERFVRQARTLVDRFIESGHVPSRITPHDALVIGDEGRVERWHSRKHKTCVVCDGKEGLVLDRVGPSGLDVRVICTNCKSGKRTA